MRMRLIAASSSSGSASRAARGGARASSARSARKPPAPFRGRPTASRISPACGTTRSRPAVRCAGRPRFRSQQVSAVQAGRRGVLRAAHRRPAARRAARVLHAVRIPVGVSRAVSGADGSEREVPGDDRPSSCASRASSRSTAGRIRPTSSRRSTAIRSGKWEGDTLVIDTDALQAVVARRQLLREPERIPDAQRRVPHDRAPHAHRREHDQVRLHRGRPQDLHGAVDRELGVQAASRNGRRPASTRWCATRTTAARAAVRQVRSARSRGTAEARRGPQAAARAQCRDDGFAETASGRDRDGGP